LRINCIHGYFIFDEVTSGELSDFVSVVGLPLARKENYFTFEALVDAPEYSITGQPYLNATAIKTYAGPPWEIMRENGLVYNFDIGLLVPIASITRTVTIAQAGNVFVSPGLILPGSLTDEGERVKDYAAWFSTDRMRFRYSEVSYVD